MASEPRPCPALPPGWLREVVVRKSGASTGHCDVYYYSPSGKKCRSKQEMMRYLDVDLAGFNYSSGHTNNVKQRQQRRAAAITNVIAKCRKTSKTSDKDAVSAKKNRLGDVGSEDHQSPVSHAFTVREHGAKQMSRLEELRKKSMASQNDFLAALNKTYSQSVDCQEGFMDDLNKMYTEQQHLHDDEAMRKKLGEDAVEAVHSVSGLTTPEHLDGSKAVEAAVHRKTKRENGEVHIKQPLNAFMLWATNERRNIPQDSPVPFDNQITFSKVLGSRWKSMTVHEKQPWYEEQVRVRKIFMEKHPDYKFNRPKYHKRATADKKLHMGKPRQKKQSQQQEMGQSFSAGRGPSSSYHKARRKSKEVHVDSNRPQVGNTSQHDAGRLTAEHPNNPQYMQARAVTDEGSVSRDNSGNDSEMHEGSAAGVTALPLVRTMNWTLDELRMLIEHQSNAPMQSEDVPMQSEDVPASDIGRLVGLYWGGSLAELKNERRRYSYRFMDDITEFCSKHITSDTVVVSHVLCSWGKMKEDYRVLDHDYVHTEVTYTSSWRNINEQLDDIDKEFGFPQSLRCALERDEQSTLESDYETAEKEDVFIENGCSVETSVDSNDPFPSIKIHVLPSDEQECSYRAKGAKSAVQSERLFSGSVENELCEMANNGKTDDNALKSAMEEYCKETMTDGCTDVREITSLKSDKETCCVVCSGEPKSISPPNRSSVDHSYGASIEEEPTVTGFYLNGSSDNKLSSGDAPDEADLELVDTTVKLSLFGSDNGRRMVNSVTRVNCGQVLLPPQILTVIDAPEFIPPGRGRKLPKFVKLGSRWRYKRPPHVFAYNP